MEGERRKIRDGYVQRFKSGFFSKKWKDCYAVLYSDSTLAWYDEKGDTSPVDSIFLKDVVPYICVGLLTDKMPVKRPEVPDGSTVHHLVGIGMDPKAETVHWFMFNSDSDLEDWFKDITRTLPKPKEQPAAIPSAPPVEPQPNYPPAPAPAPLPTPPPPQPVPYYGGGGGHTTVIIDRDRERERDNYGGYSGSGLGFGSGLLMGSLMGYGVGSAFGGHEFGYGIGPMVSPYTYGYGGGMFSGFGSGYVQDNDTFVTNNYYGGGGDGEEGHHHHHHHRQDPDDRDQGEDNGGRRDNAQDQPQPEPQVDYNEGDDRGNDEGVEDDGNDDYGGGEEAAYDDYGGDDGGDGGYDGGDDY